MLKVDNRLFRVDMLATNSIFENADMNVEWSLHRPIIEVE